jgi:hypothetical protein
MLVCFDVRLFNVFLNIRTPLQTCLSPQHAFDSVARKRIEEEDQKDDQHQPEEDLDDGPLVVVPDDVANGLDGVQEPHEGGVRPPEKNVKTVLFYSKRHT